MKFLYKIPLFFFMLIAHLCVATSVNAEAVNVAEREIQEIAPLSSVQVLKKIDRLMSQGVPGLALRLIEQKQAEISAVNIEQWSEFEYRRIKLLKYLHDWPKLIVRIEHQLSLIEQKSLVFSDKHWYQTQKIKAQLKLGQFDKALTELQELLWNLDVYRRSDDVAIWRQLVIRVYMSLDRLQDAQRAMRRYQQDYGTIIAGDAGAWKRLQAQLLLRTNRMAEAVQLLSSATSPRDRTLFLLAKMQAGLLSDWAVADKLTELLENPYLEPADQLYYRYGLFIAQASQKKFEVFIGSLEKLLLEKDKNNLRGFYYPAKDMLSVDYLWQSYEAFGKKIANAENLLQGDDAKWYLKASNWNQKKTQQAKALLAVLLFAANSDIHRLQASALFMEIIEKQTDGFSLLYQLFMKSKKITDLKMLPLNVRYHLVDFSLSKADLKTAAELMSSLERPPEGEDSYAWSLRRARVFVLGGEYQRGIDVLQRILKARENISEDQADQFMQVVFDLQNIEQHKYALQLFSSLQAFDLSERLQRELPFWQAESYQALGNEEQAAYLYLQSAQPLNGKYDPWFHTASFRAAVSLAKAGLNQDARIQFLRLLKITSSAARKSVINQRLQQLRLKMNQAK